MFSSELSSEMRQGACINIIGVTPVIRLTLVKWIFLISKGKGFFFVQMQMSVHECKVQV